MANISMAKVRARLNRVLSASKKVEAVKPRRAWSGKIKKIDELLAWMYDKGIMNKGERAKKIPYSILITVIIMMGIFPAFYLH